MLSQLKSAIVPSISRRTATLKAREYEAAHKKTRDPKYRELGIIHRHLARGFKLISINKAMEIAGVKPNGCPVLAIANAAAKWVWFEYDAGMSSDPDRRWQHPMSAFVSDFADNPGKNNNGNSASYKCRFRFNRNFFPIRPTLSKMIARVPVIPPQHIPAKGGIAEYQILWEADWLIAPVDPLLLKRISREFFIVLAEWNLTEIERLVLEMAAFSGE